MLCMDRMTAIVLFEYVFNAHRVEHGTRFRDWSYGYRRRSDFRLLLQSWIGDLAAKLGFAAFLLVDAVEEGRHVEPERDPVHLFVA